jgi:hypothetical protein
MKPIVRPIRLFHSELGYVVDEEGLPVVDYGRRLGKKVGRKRNPVLMGIVGLKATQSSSLVGLPEFDRTGNDILPHIRVERMARWLLDSSIDRGSYMVYHLDFPWPEYLLKPPWRSCLAEAFSGMFLVAWGTVRKDERYVDCGLKHIRSLLVPVSKGGLKSDHSNVFLEYTGYERRKRWPLVLNGHLYSLVTLFTAWKMLGIEEFGGVFEQAIAELEGFLPVFEGPFFTYYDDLGNPAKLFYHQIHVHLLERLYALTGLPYLRATANEWRGISRRYNFALALLMRAFTMRIPYVPRR